MFVRMVIGEAASEEHLREFVEIVQGNAPAMREQPGLQRTDLMVEEDGRMAVLLTVWDSREHCLQYHSSRPYRQFVAKTQHLLVGNFVVKLFRME